MAERRVALVTGANRGIGREVARQLASRGLVTIFGARDPRQAEVAAREVGGHARQLDVTDQASVDRLLAGIDAEFGRLDVLVNNAAVGYDEDRRAGEVALAAVEATLATNLVGPWRLCLAALPLMRRGGYGRIVNISSGSGSFAETEQDRDPSAPAYSVSKAALNMLTLKLAYELMGTNILVNAVCPGWVRTDMGGPYADRSVGEGAETPVWLATLPDGGPTGGFFRDRRPIPW
jgi:NAD(P)-dependent dehydrogenase (short-subunit alcohol dehydrogenase family)